MACWGRILIAATIKPKDWIRLPSKNVVSVRRVYGDVVTVRAMDDNGAMHSSDYQLALEFLKKHGELVVVNA